MATNIFIYRTSVEAGAAPDAIKAFPLLLIGENICSSIVQQNNIHLFRSVHFIGLSGPRDDGIVRSDLLPGSESSQQWPEQTKISQRRNNFLDTHDHNMCFGH